MIDLRMLREDPEVVRRSQLSRGEDPGLVDALLAAEIRRRNAVMVADQIRARQKELGRQVGRASPGRRAELLAGATDLAAQVRQAEAEQAAAESELRTAHLAIPNLVADGVPAGGEDDYVVIETVGEIPTYGFEPRDHLAVGRYVGALDTDRAAKVSGARFFFLTGPGARLELALLNLAMDRALANGFVPMVPPALVKPDAMEGTGFLGAHAAEVYRLQGDDLYLVGTSEVPLAAYHADEILQASTLPLRYVGWSSCFRREAGSYGKDTRGILRVHQFDKAEMFVFCEPRHAAAEHLRLLELEKELLGLLELPYRVIDVAAGDLGTSAARKYDCEVWMPTQGRYREVTSTSDCTDFQARRLGIRFRGESGRPTVAATLNGTLVAMARTIACLLEVHQQADGSVRVPAALRPYLGGLERIEPVG